MKTSEIYVREVNYNSDVKGYESVCVPQIVSVTVLISNLESFTDVFGDMVLQQMVLQNLRDNVMAEYNSGKTFPKHATAPYKTDGDATFDFNRMERDEYGENLVVYYEYISTIS